MRYALQYALRTGFTTIYIHPLFQCIQCKVVYCVLVQQCVINNACVPDSLNDLRSSRFASFFLSLFLFSFFLPIVFRFIVSSPYLINSFSLVSLPFHFPILFHFPSISRSSYTPFPLSLSPFIVPSFLDSVYRGVSHLFNGFKDGGKDSPLLRHGKGGGTVWFTGRIDGGS